MHKTLLGCFSICLAMSGAACSSAPETGGGDAGSDAASALDAAHATDTGSTIDTGRDAASVVDTGSTIDAASSPDANATDAASLPDTGHDAAAVSDAGRDAAMASDAGAGTCPPNPPTNGTACSPTDLACSYGNDPRVSCRVHATCNHGTWLVTAPPCSAPPTCPDTESAGTMCDTRGASCGYATDTCVCYACTIPCTAPTTWHCSAAATGCPTSPPNLGDTCTGTEVCNYGACTGGEAVQCTGGIWVQHFMACPG